MAVYDISAKRGGTSLFYDPKVRGLVFQAIMLVALVAFLVQLYSLGYLDTEPPASLGRYYVYQSLFAFSMMVASSRARSSGMVATTMPPALITAR